jgi:hypothetical protein
MSHKGAPNATCRFQLKGCQHILWVKTHNLGWLHVEILVCLLPIVGFTCRLLFLANGLSVTGSWLLVVGLKVAGSCVLEQWIISKCNGKSYSWQWSTALQQLLINNQLLLMLKLQSLATVFPIISWVAAWLPVKKWCRKVHSLECRLPLSWLNNRMQLPLYWLNNIIHSCTSWIRQSLL